jgi:LacI family transcriptional regulator
MAALVPSLTHATFAAAINAMQRRLAQRGFALMVSTSTYDDAVEVSQLLSIVSAGVDGVFLVGAERDAAAYALLTRRDLPFVCSYVDAAPAGGVAVGFDNARLGEIAVSHLTELGHRAIGLIGGPAARGDRARMRRDGVERALASRGLSLVAGAVYETEYGVVEGQRALCEILDGLAGRRPTALICGNDAIAFGAMAEARRAGLSLPGDLSIVAFGGQDYAPLIDPPLTTISLPVAAIGEHAADWLVAAAAARAGGEAPPPAAPVLLPTRLEIRGSTAPPRR